MDVYAKLQNHLEETTQSVDVLNLQFDEFIAALRAKDWVKAHELRVQIGKTTDRLLNSTLVGFLTLDVIEGNFSDGT